MAVWLAVPAGNLPEKQERGRSGRPPQVERECPIEDSGGPLGYTRMLKALVDKHHEEHESTKACIWKVAQQKIPFDPNHFDATQVKFADADRYLAKLVKREH